MKTNIIHNGSSFEELQKMPSESVDCVITSPPYWGLRDYGTAEWEGGDESCEHLMPLQTTRGGSKSTLTSVGAQEATNANTTQTHKQQYKDICKNCGAKRIDSQLGLEKTPEEYVENMVQVFREVRRVLKNEGTVWLNLGDSYASPKVGNTETKKNPKVVTNSFRKKLLPGLKPKDLVGIPWRVAFALQADGWYLRQDIIWHKPNPMPESVRDRCTKSHEYIFLLSKNKKYYYDNDAIKEPAAYDGRKDEMMKGSEKYKNSVVPNQAEHTMAARGHKRWNKDSEGNRVRNKRSVWTITTKPFKEAHFAVFPEALIEPMVLAGCPKDGTILDPFFGAGTTGVVAKKNGRNYVGIELNKEYVEMAERRIGGVNSPLF